MKRLKGMLLNDTDRSIDAKKSEEAFSARRSLGHYSKKGKQGIVPAAMEIMRLRQTQTFIGYVITVMKEDILQKRPETKLQRYLTK